MSIKLKNNVRHKGFMLYESIVALMVTILTISVLQQSLQLMKSIQNTIFREQLRWHITQEKLQSMLDDAYEIRKITSSQIIFSKTKLLDKKHPVFVLSIREDKGTYDRMLRITTATNGGHEPILMHQREIKIEKISNLVIITTVNQAGEKSEMYLTLKEKSHDEQSKT